jgi:hypothetical protein
LSRGGKWKTESLCRDVDCPEPPPEDECRSIDAGVHVPHVPKGGYRWTYDLCPPAFFEPIVTEGGDGYARPQSIHPVRAVEVDLGQVDQGPMPGESCAYHFGDMDIGLDGFAEPYFCSQPNYARSHNQLTVMRPVIQRVGDAPDEADADSVMQDGFAAFVGAYHSPYWTEAQFHSGIQYCGQAE